MIRNILAVLAGYAIFVAGSVALFKVSGHDPHAVPTLTAVLVIGLFGAVISFIAGWVAHLIGKAGGLRINYSLALVMAGFALFSFFKSEGSHWTQLLAIFVLAPASILGGRFQRKRSGN